MRTLGRDVACPDDGHGLNRCLRESSNQGEALVELYLLVVRPHTRSLGIDEHALPALDGVLGTANELHVGRAPYDGDGTYAGEDPGDQFALVELALIDGTYAHTSEPE